MEWSDNNVGLKQEDENSQRHSMKIRMLKLWQHLSLLSPMSGFDRLSFPIFPKVWSSRQEWSRVELSSAGFLLG